MREKIRLDSSAGTGHFYTTTKNKRTMTEKFEIKKFDPTIRKHVITISKHHDKRIVYSTNLANVAGPQSSWS